jgi:phosphohistidine phosphatase
MSPEDAQTRRLILLRHAKSDWPTGVDDRERPLAERGRRDAPAAGLELAQIAVPDAVLCSPALRARQTWQLASQSLDPQPPTRFVPELYGASVEEMIDLLRMIPHNVATALVVGHEPTISATASTLAGPGSNQADLDRLRTKFPTCAMAVFRLEPGWAELNHAGAVLERFLIPRAPQTPS